MPGEATMINEVIRKSRFTAEAPQLGRGECLAWPRPARAIKATARARLFLRNAMAARSSMARLSAPSADGKSESRGRSAAGKTGRGVLRRHRDLVPPERNGAPQNDLL